MSEMQIEKIIKHGYKEIYVIGHSMGGVIAAYLASKYKEVKKLVLAAPAFQYFKFEGNKINILESIVTCEDERARRWMVFMDCYTPFLKVDLL